MISSKDQVLDTNNPLRPKGMYQVHLGPQSGTNHTTKTRTDLRANVQHMINMTEQQTAEASQSQASRPLTITVGAMQPLPTSGENQKRTQEGGAGLEQPLGWLA